MPSPEKELREVKWEKYVPSLADGNHPPVHLPGTRELQLDLLRFKDPEEPNKLNILIKDFLAALKTMGMVI